MRFLQTECLGVQVTDLDKIRVRLRNVPSSMVVGVVSKKGIFAGRNVVKPEHAKILPDRLRSIAEVLCGSASLAVNEILVTVGRRPEGVDEWQYPRLQIGNRTTTRRGGSRRHQALASAVIRHNRELAQRQPLLKPFVVPKQKQLGLLDGASQRSSKLIPFKRRGAGGLIEEVPCIEGAVAQILEGGSMPLIGSRGGHDGDLAPCSFSILGAIGMLEDVIFPHRIHSQ